MLNRDWLEWHYRWNNDDLDKESTHKYYKINKLFEKLMTEKQNNDNAEIYEALVDCKERFKKFKDELDDQSIIYYRLYWNMAKANKALGDIALEEGDENKELYYYCESIRYCTEALSHLENEDGFDMIYKYMIYRYQDISDSSSGINSEIREQAKYIKETLENWKK